jgi:hypothetical protein
MKALFLGHFAAKVAARILAKMKAALDSSILDDENDTAHLGPLLADAEIVISHIWRANFPPAARLRLVWGAHPASWSPFSSHSSRSSCRLPLASSAPNRGLLLCRSLTASEWQMFRLARLPYAMSFVFAGMKVGVTTAVCRSRLAAAYALRGDSERAAAELAEARRLNGDLYSRIAHVKAGGYFGVPKIRALYERTYFAGLRKAGMPEE